MMTNCSKSILILYPTKHIEILGNMEVTNLFKPPVWLLVHTSCVIRKFMECVQSLDLTFIHKSLRPILKNKSVSSFGQLIIFFN